VVNEVGLGVEIRYARLADDLAAWELETVLARQDRSEELMGWPSIILSGGELIVVYQDSFPPTRFVRRSSDEGQTWSSPVKPFPHIGGYQAAVPLEDSAGRIHLILGNRQPSPEIHGMWYSQMLGGFWRPLESIVSGPRLDAFDPCCPQAVISQGNVLLATWPHNVNREFLTGAWYTYRLLDAPRVPEVPMPTAPVLATAVATPFETAASTPTPQPTASSVPIVVSPSPSEVTQARNPALPIFLSVVPVVVVLVAIAVRRRAATAGGR
jgi:hypothetical protein